MRIAIFTNNYLPNPYGVSMSIESFRAELEKHGHTVYIFAPKFKGYQDQNPNVFRYCALDLEFRGVRYPIAIPFSYKLDRILAKLELDVIHAQHPNLLGSAAKKWARKKKIPLVFTWHTLYDQYAHFAPLVPTKFAAWWSINNAKNFANSCDQVIVPTPSVIQTIKNWGVTNPKITAIATGVDRQLYQDMNRNVIRQKYNISGSEIFILLVSRITPEKNINFLFEAMLPVIKLNQKLKFMIVGDGGKRSDLEKQVAGSGLSEQIYFTGIIPATEIKEYYAAADIFVHASKSETQGMILTEAMYAGLPTVAIEASGAKDLVRNNETGFLVNEDQKEFGEAIMRLVNDEELRKTFSDNAKKIARENYTSSICSKKLIDVYQKAIEERRIN